MVEVDVEAGLLEAALLALDQHFYLLPTPHTLALDTPRTVGIHHGQLIRAEKDWQYLHSAPHHRRQRTFNIFFPHSRLLSASRSGPQGLNRLEGLASMATHCILPLSSPSVPCDAQGRANKSEIVRDRSPRDESQDNCLCFCISRFLRLWRCASLFVVFSFTLLVEYRCEGNELFSLPRTVMCRTPIFK